MYLHKKKYSSQCRATLAIPGQSPQVPLAPSLGVAALLIPLASASLPSLYDILGSFDIYFFISLFCVLVTRHLRF